jgi:hypothetical protein
LPSESIHLFRIFRFKYQATGTCTVKLYTDMPGGSYALRETWTLDATTGEEMATLKCDSDTKGFQAKFRFEPSSTAMLYIYGLVEAYARRIGRLPSDWAWHIVGIVPGAGSDELIPIKIPIPPTSDHDTALKIPIPPTSTEFATIKMPIPETGQQYLKVAIPLPDTPDAERWADFEMDE